jgi:hypothetical protein
MKHQAKTKLMSSAKDNRRYFYINSDDRRKIEGAILEYVGILGFAESAFMFIKDENNKLIGSCLRESLDKVRASLAFRGIKIQKVSGTIAGLAR